MRSIAMRTSEAFILGTITGAVVASLWGKKLEDYAGEKTRRVRARAAAGMQTIEEKAGQVLEHGGQSLRRAEEFLEDTREHVTDALRASQNAIRPTPTTGKS
jgi:gas vesicle protein